jgi:uncharacterized membrane protein HdeD (DUF308 family)
MTLGASLSVLGVSGIARSTMATFTSPYFYGAVLVAAAAVECLNALMVGRWSGYSLHLLGIPLLGITGVLLLRYTLFTPGSLTGLMAAYFFLGGAFEAFPSFLLSLPDRHWHVLNGYVSALLGFLVLVQGPISQPWGIGTLIGIDLLFRGLTWTAFAFDLRAVSQFLAEPSRNRGIDLVSRERRP